VFGRKDSIKEFEQMRQALKPAERFANRADVEEVVSQDPTDGNGAIVSIQTPPMSEILVPPAVDHRSSVVSVGSSWQGTLKIDGSVRLEGEVTGEIDAKDTVFVAETAKVNAKVRAAQVIIAGSFEGEVDCSDRLQIMPTGRVKAELTTKLLTVFEGAIIEGVVRMNREAHAATTVLPSRPNDNSNRKPGDKPVVVPIPDRASAASS